MDFKQRVTKAPAAEEFSITIQETLAQTKANLQKAQDPMKIQVDKHCSNAPKYSIRDKVWLSTENLKLTYAFKKLTEWLGENAVKLHLPCLIKNHLVINIFCFCPYKEHLEGQPTFQPGPVNVTDDHEVAYEMDHIVNICFKGNQLEYLVHWKEYTDEEHTWESLCNLTGTQEAPKNFHKYNPNAPQQIQLAQIEFFASFTDFSEPLQEAEDHKLLFNHLEVNL